MKLKSRNRFLAILAGLFLTLLCVSGAPIVVRKQPKKAYAETTPPTLEIVSQNVSYSDSVFMLYAVANEGFDREEYTIQMLFWSQPQQEYLLGTQDYVAKSSGSGTVKEKDCLIFYSKGLAAKEMTDNIYSRACVTIDGVTYYSDTMKYSVLEYVYYMREKGTLDSARLDLLQAMLTYGAAAQKVFDYNTDRLATDTYYNVEVENGVLSDGFSQGRYKANETLVLTANAPETSYEFSHWLDKDGNIVAKEQQKQITITGANTYTAVYRKLAEDLEYTLSDDGKYYTVTGIGTCAETNFAIPSTYKDLPVTGIGQYAFNGCAGVTNVVIPDSVTSIGRGAFYECSSLTEIVIPEGVTMIEANTFFACSNLESVTIPKTVTSIGDNAFGSCYNLKSVHIFDMTAWCDIEFSWYVNSHPLEHGANLYVNNQLVTDIVFPEGTTMINGMAFYCYNSLVSVTIPKSVTEIYGMGLRSCPNMEKIYYMGSVEDWCNIDDIGTPFTENDEFYIDGELVCDLVIPDTVTVLTDEIFANYKGLKSVSIPESVESIGVSAFNNCDGLVNITIPNSVTSLGEQAFKDCDALTSVIIGDGVTSIGEETFYDCDALTKVVIGDGVTTIGVEAFYGCDALTDVTIGVGVKKIDEKAFYLCKKVDNVYITDIAAWCGIYFHSYTYGPDSYASNPLFYGANLYVNNELATNLVIPDTVTSIGQYAFYRCENMTTSIVIPASVSRIGTNAFYACSNLVSVYYTGDVAGWCSINFANASANPLGYADELYINNQLITELVIPDTVTSINTYAFYGCRLTSVVIGSNVTSIGNAFDCCSLLNSITFNGTIAQWNAISKGSYWNYRVPATEVVCSDGTVTL